MVIRAIPAYVCRLPQGMQAMGLGLVGGVSGVFQEPVRGAMEGGKAGFIKGVGRGLVGVVAKPMSGFAGMVSKTSEGMASDAKRVTVRGKEKDTQLRVRQPREIGADSVLLPYPGGLSHKF